MTSKPPTIGRQPDARDLWLEYFSAAAVQAITHIHGQFLVKTGGDEQAASNLTWAWALLVGQNFPGMPPETYTGESLNRWRDAHQRTRANGGNNA
jgi:hypothetical protein